MTSSAPKEAAGEPVAWAVWWSPRQTIYDIFQVEKDARMAAASLSKEEGGPLEVTPLYVHPPAPGDAPPPMPPKGMRVRVDTNPTVYVVVGPARFGGEWMVGCAHTDQPDKVVGIWRKADLVSVDDQKEGV